MFNVIKNFIYDLFYENGNASMTKVLACYGYFIFTIITLYLVLTDQTWAYYSEAGAYLAGSATALVAGNKFVDSKYNTIQGGFGTVDGTRLSGKASLKDNIENVHDLLGKIDKEYTDISNGTDKLKTVLNRANEINTKTESFKDKYFRKNK